VMQAGSGYISRAVDGQSYSGSNNTAVWNTNSAWLAPFIGVPHNGNYNFNVYATPAIDNLIGNPYPSALDLTSLVADNNTLLGKFYFWVHATPAINNVYEVGDYATWNQNSGGGAGAGQAGKVSLPMHLQRELFRSKIHKEWQATIMDFIELQIILPQAQPQLENTMLFG
jgi:hypothetical protein